jgi:hypothetical protein
MQRPGIRVPLRVAALRADPGLERRKPGKLEARARACEQHNGNRLVVPMRLVRKLDLGERPELLALALGASSRIAHGTGTLSRDLQIDETLAQSIVRLAMTRSTTRGGSSSQHRLTKGASTTQVERVVSAVRLRSILVFERVLVMPVAPNRRP